MGDRNIEDYVVMLNMLYKATGMLIESNTKLYKVNEPKSENTVVAEIKWDNNAKEYYPRYVH